MKFIVFLISFFTFINTDAQVKVEKEYRLKVKNVPNKALTFVDSLEFDKTVKWYREESFKETSIEAKGKIDCKKYSVEFDDSGNLQDIEVEIEEELLPKSVFENITVYLGTVFKEYSIRKIQVQYLGETKDLWSLIVKKNESAIHNVNYEIVVKGDDGNEKTLNEFLFSSEGDFVKKAKFIFRDTNNMEF